MEPSGKNKIDLAAHVYCTLEDLIAPLPHSGKLVIAYSGGMDSHALLHILAGMRRHRKTPSLLAVHINHAVHPQADQWEAHVRQICQNLHVEYIPISVHVDAAKGLSLEAQARQARYAALAEMVSDGDVLVTAQHQDDQAETLLLQLLRGSGIDGLSSMPAVCVFSRGWHCRPMLGVSRHKLAAYAQAHALEWVEDSTNASTVFDRNYLRHAVMPVLKKRWPAAAATLSRAARHCAASADLLETLLRGDFLNYYDGKSATLDMAIFDGRSPNEREALLRMFIKKTGQLMPSTKKMREIQRQIWMARGDANPLVKWGHCEIRRFQNRLYLMPALLPHDRQKTIDWTLEQTVIGLGNLGEVRLKEGAEAGLSVTKLAGRRLSIRFRQGGERLILPRRQGTHALKKIFQEQAIPPWQRDRIPLVYADETLVMAVGVATAREYYADSGKTLSVHHCSES